MYFIEVSEVSSSKLLVTQATHFGSEFTIWCLAAKPLSSLLDASLFSMDLQGAPRSLQVGSADLCLYSPETLWLQSERRAMDKCGP